MQVEQIHHSSARSIIRFGDQSLSDVHIIVDVYEFRIHKMILANNFGYFKKLLYGGTMKIFKKLKISPNKLKRYRITGIRALTFHRLLQFAYNGEITGADDFMPCCKVCKPPEGDGSKKFWKETGDLLDTAELFSMTDAINQYVERMISKEFTDCKWGCWECFNGYLFSIVYNLDVAQRYKQYDACALYGWSKYFSMNVPPAKQLSMAQLCDIFKSLRKGD